MISPIKELCASINLTIFLIFISLFRLATLFSPYMLSLLILFFINEEEIPLDINDLSYNSQQALFLFNVLPDKIEGMNGIWLGKEYAGLADIMDIYEIDNRKDVLDLLQICIREASKIYSKQREQANKQAEAQAKMRK